jgi:Tfp pilus assembly pilus retraction ATPase PilT
MARPDWDRLFGTCYKGGGTDLFLIPGSPPLIRLADGWHSMLAGGDLTLPDVVSLARERLGATPDGQADGYSFSDFAFGNVARFRVMAFGYPKTTMLLVARWPDKFKPTA